MRLRATILCLSLLASTSPSFSSTPPKAGSSCPRQGVTQIYNGLKFTCIKSGKKLVWDKGVAVKVNAPSPTTTLSPGPTPSPTQSPSPSPAPSLSPTPSPTPTSSPKVSLEPLAPKDFQSLELSFDGIQFWSWKKASEKISKTAPNLGAIKVAIGPNTIPDNQDPLTPITLVSRLYSNFKQASEVRIVYASEKDIEWGQSQINNLCPGIDCGYDVNGEAKKACNVPITPCWGGLAVTNKKLGIPMIYMTASDWGKSDPNHTQGTLEAHEYSHTIQQISGAPDNSENKWNTLPRWLVEGGATWIASASVFYSNFSAYQSEINRNIDELKNKIHPSSEWVTEFLNPEPVDGWTYWNSYENWRLYDVGLLATEILTSLKGPDSVMNLFKSVGNGKTFMEAFKDEYGISWKEAVPIIARVIEKETR